MKELVDIGILSQEEFDAKSTKFSAYKRCIHATRNS